MLCFPRCLSSSSIYWPWILSLLSRWLFKYSKMHILTKLSFIYLDFCSNWNKYIMYLFNDDIYSAESLSYPFLCSSIHIIYSLTFLMIISEWPLRVPVCRLYATYSDFCAYQFTVLTYWRVQHQMKGRLNPHDDFFPKLRRMKSKCETKHLGNMLF